MDLSVIVPLAPGETERPRLAPLSVEHEVRFVDPEGAPGRARQLNKGARAARGRWLWFVHADSTLSPEACRAVERVVREGKPALYYFDLRFRGDGPRAMPLNAWGVHFRSRVLKMPFGDQAFLVPASMWRALGGFVEDRAYGEDHVFAWAARRAGFEVRAIGAAVETSARKYARQGWWRTTAHHLVATYTQAAGEARQTWRVKRPGRRRECAVAIFVKTPGLSPLKTRLAAGTSAEFAADFYGASVRAMKALGSSLRADGFAPYWAVAEAQGVSHGWWRDFRIVDQGEGGLGDRLGHVYEALLAKHERVIFLGCDCPQVSAELLREARHRLEGADFVFGPAADGGFYLFGGRKPIERAAWRSIAYSEATTLAQLSAVLQGLGSIEYLSTRTDADTRADLAPVLREITSAGPESFSAAHWNVLLAIAEGIRAAPPK